jgi:hypothetical protein
MELFGQRLSGKPAPIPIAKGIAEWLGNGPDILAFVRSSPIRSPVSVCHFLNNRISHLFQGRLPCNSLVLSDASAREDVTHTEKMAKGEFHYLPP